MADEHKLALMYDASHAFGASIERQATLSAHSASTEVFSFHATKFLNAFEGGAVVTNDDELAPPKCS